MTFFHRAYIYSVLSSPNLDWEGHFRSAQAASAYAVQHLGNEASLPTIADVNETQACFGERRKDFSLVGDCKSIDEVVATGGVA